MSASTSRANTLTTTGLSATDPNAVDPLRVRQIHKRHGSAPYGREPRPKIHADQIKLRDRRQPRLNPHPIDQKHHSKQINFFKLYASLYQLSPPGHRSRDMTAFSPMFSSTTLSVPPSSENRLFPNRETEPAYKVGSELLRASRHRSALLPRRDSAGRAPPVLTRRPRAVPVPCRRRLPRGPPAAGRRRSLRGQTARLAMFFTFSRRKHSQELGTRCSTFRRQRRTEFVDGLLGATTLDTTLFRAHHPPLPARATTAGQEQGHISIAAEHFASTFLGGALLGSPHGFGTQARHRHRSRMAAQDKQHDLGLRSRSASRCGSQVRGCAYLQDGHTFESKSMPDPLIEPKIRRGSAR